MKKAVVIFAASLLWKPISTSPTTTYLPCYFPDYQNFRIRNWSNTTSNNSTHVINFELYANFSGYTSACSGIGDIGKTSAWFDCDSSSESSSPLSSSPSPPAWKTGASFIYYSWGAIGLEHTFICDRGETEENPRNRFARVIATGVGEPFDPPNSHYKVPNGTITAYPTIAHPLPQLNCASKSQHTEWEVRNFDYHAEYTPNEMTIGYTTASINFGLFNNAIDYEINCQGLNMTYDTQDPWEETLIDPKKRFLCQVNSDDGLNPAEDYPTAGFSYDRVDNRLIIDQQWDCEDEGLKTTYSAKGSTIFELKCRDNGPAGGVIPKIVGCDLVTTTVKAEILS